jgi:hypothetical protein
MRAGHRGVQHQHGGQRAAILCRARPVALAPSNPVFTTRRRACKATDCKANCQAATRAREHETKYK